MELTSSFYQRLESSSFLLITLLGIANGQVSAFYMIYFFWFQELIRTLIEGGFVLWSKNPMLLSSLKQILPSLFLLFIYLVFIIVLFGGIFAWHDTRLLSENITILAFRNWFFNINLVVFAVTFFIYTQNNVANICITAFNRRHIILHIAIILAAVLHSFLLPKITDNHHWIALGATLPFILLKLLLDRKSYQ